MSYKLVIAEKPSVAQSIAKVIGADKREDGYLEGNGYIVSWCVGHLVELASPESYDEKYEKWRYEDLPILPSEWNYQIAEATRKQFGILKKLMERIYIQTGCSGTGRRECIDNYQMDAVWRIPVYRSREGSESPQAAVFELAE